MVYSLLLNYFKAKLQCYVPVSLWEIEMGERTIESSERETPTDTHRSLKHRHDFVVGHDMRSLDCSQAHGGNAVDPTRRSMKRRDVDACVLMQHEINEVNAEH